MRQPIIILALAAAFVTQAHAQTDNLVAAKAAVQACVENVRNQAKQPENLQFGAPPMWKDFDAYIAPDGRVFNNVRFVGEEDGLYRFNKCLAERGFTVGGAFPVPSPRATATCSDKELLNVPGDCWIKLSAWEKHLFVSAFQAGQVYSHDFAKRQQHEWGGTAAVKFFPYLDENQQRIYFDHLYSSRKNKTISFDESFDLAMRKHTNPQTKDVHPLLDMYRKGLKPIFNGYLRGFLPPNKVTVSEFSSSQSSASYVKRIGNKTATVALLGVSSDADNRASSTDAFMKRLLNLKTCNSLIRQNDAYNYYTFSTKQQREQEKKMEEFYFFPELEMTVFYPLEWEYQQEEFFDGTGELSGVVLLKKHQTICYQKNHDLISPVTLGQLMLGGTKDPDAYSAIWLGHPGDAFIDLNRYLIENGLRRMDVHQNDPRPAARIFETLRFDGNAPTKEGVEKVMAVGAQSGH